MGCSPWGRKELGMTRRLALNTCQEATHTHTKMPRFMNRKRDLKFRVSAAWAYEG